MNLRNPFSREVKNLFSDAWECWECGENGMRKGGLDGHHITGRGSNSPYNFAPLCRMCHNLVGHTDEEEYRYFKKTAKYLRRVDYIKTKKDDDFIEKYFRNIINKDYAIF